MVAMFPRVADITGIRGIRHLTINAIPGSRSQVTGYPVGAVGTLSLLSGRNEVGMMPSARHDIA
jgi:hypothetical protein